MRPLIIITILFSLFGISGCKKDNSDPNLAFKSLKLDRAVNTGTQYWITSGTCRLIYKDSVLAMQEHSYPFTPTVLYPSTIKMRPTNQFQMAQDKNSVLLTSWEPSLGNMDNWSRWVDISDPHNIQLLATISSTKLKSGSGCIQGGLCNGYLYMNEQVNHLVCYNLNAAKGKMVSDINTLKVFDIVITGITYNMYAHEINNYLYLGGNGSHIYVFDISNRNIPTIISHIDEQLSTGFEQNGNILVSKGNNKLLLIDVNHPENPQLLYRINSLYSDVKFHGDYLYISDNFISIYDLASSKKPKLVKHINVAPEKLSHLNFIGNYIMASSLTTNNSYPMQNTVYFTGNTK